MKIRVKSRVKTTSRPRGRRVTPWLATSAFAAYATLGGRSVSPALAGTRRAPRRRWPRRARASGRSSSSRSRPGPLADVMAAFQQATGWSVVFADDAVRSLQSAGVNGVFTPEQALKRILAGTGVTHRVTGADAVTLDLRREESVLVTARVSTVASPKYTEPLRDMPQTITVIPASVIQEQNATTLRDVLRNVPGITIQAGEGGVPAGDNLTIRGFSARTDMFVDGVRDFGGYSRDPFNIEQVEVTKGPASSFAGRGSTGGSINLVSKAPGRGHRAARAPSAWATTPTSAAPST